VIVSKGKKTPPTFPARDGVQLTAAFLQIMSKVERRDFALACLNEDLRSGQLGSALAKISPDGKITMTPLKRSDWQQLTLQVPLRPQEGVGVQPYVDGYVSVRRADLDRRYPIAATPTTAVPQSDDIRPPEGRAADASRPRRQSLRQEILGVILHRYYPQGVPADMSTSAVEQTVAAAWKSECQTRGFKPTEPPKYDTIARRLGRRRD
jgi:hypothetical protein